MRPFPSARISGYLLTAVAALHIPSVSRADIGAARPKLATKAEAVTGTADQFVVPVTSNLNGTTYADMSALWWQWWATLPGDTSAFCQTQQPTPSVVLLAAPIGSTYSETCSIPAGTALFFPVFDAECSNTEAAPFYGATPGERAQCAASLADLATGMQVFVDRRPVTHLESYRVPTGDQTLHPAAENIAYIPPCTGTDCSVLSSADGYYIFVKPLSPGQHTIQFRAHIPAFHLNIDTTYTINVLPGN